MNRMTVSLATIALLALSPAVSLAQSEKPDATVEFSGRSVAIGAGYSWGRGVLHFNGMNYPFTINGLSIVDVGASSAKAVGRVYHLAKIEDFPGNYTAITAGVTIAGGGSGTAMQNQNGVVMQVSSKTRGLQFTLAPSGIAVAFDGSPTPMSGSSSPPR